MVSFLKLLLAFLLLSGFFSYSGVLLSQNSLYNSYLLKASSLYSNNQVTDKKINPRPGLITAQTDNDKTIKKDPHNPHYFNYKGKLQPLVGTAGGNCYGFVINGNFNYHVFFDTVSKYRVNYVSLWAHQLSPTQMWKDMDLPLAPKNADGILQPWAPTAIKTIDGSFWPFKFDLTKWDTAYFNRLRDFVDCAASHDVVVNMFFDDLTSQDAYDLTAFCPGNNVNGTEKVDPAEYFVIDGHPVLTSIHDKMIKKIVQELNYADNVIYFICDEIGHAGAGRDTSYYHKVYNWLSHKVDVIKNTEKSLPKKHPVAVQQQMCSYPLDFSEDSRTDFNVHQYTWWGWNYQTGGLRALDYEYYHNKPLDFNETRNLRKDETSHMFYYGDQILCQRLDMWSFMIGGGASFLSNSKEFTVSAPGGLHTEFNSKALTEIKNLRDFLDSLPLVSMTKSDMSWLRSKPSGASARAICKEGIQYAMYMHHSTFRDGDSARYYPDTGGFSSGMTKINLPRGKTYHYIWVDPATNIKIGEGELSGGKDVELHIPLYSRRPDIALRIIKSNK